MGKYPPAFSILSGQAPAQKHLGTLDDPTPVDTGPEFDLDHCITDAQRALLPPQPARLAPLSPAVEAVLRQENMQDLIGNHLFAALIQCELYLMDPANADKEYAIDRRHDLLCTHDEISRDPLFASKTQIHDRKTIYVGRMPHFLAVGADSDTPAAFRHSARDAFAMAAAQAKNLMAQREVMETREKIEDTLGNFYNARPRQYINARIIDAVGPSAMASGPSLN